MSIILPPTAQTRPQKSNSDPHVANQPERKVRTSARPGSYIGRLATTDDVRRDAYRIRYRSYVAGGYIQPNATGLFSDSFDDMPNARTIVLYDRDLPVASVRTCTLTRGTDLTSPARETFGEEVDALLAKKNDGFAGRGIETNRLVRNPEAENNQGLVFLLFRMAAYVAICTHSQVHFACARPNHAPFYKRMGYEPASGLRPYPGLTCQMRLLESDRERLDRVRRTFPVIDPLGGSTGNLAGFFKGEPFTVSLAGA
ncbi:hypothetical protein JYU29_11045 [Tianweitania sp. BSSL-BM11]|uniref:N-acyl amino acid synthase FeeM catalytic core domain-containing protein n=1 Tax=Tianweitania aestuarii TaxID=2814886 RepID=A0ABS5RVY4_9HYPH|nr:hypothetical protein [Tianweitania aestuarii]MBS9721223.1 hypothetical protein [Tianweitania aestuarii]